MQKLKLSRDTTCKIVFSCNVKSWSWKYTGQITEGGYSFVVFTNTDQKFSLFVWMSSRLLLIIKCQKPKLFLCVLCSKFWVWVERLHSKDSKTVIQNFTQKSGLKFHSSSSSIKVMPSRAEVGATLFVVPMTVITVNKK